MGVDIYENAVKFSQGPNFNFMGIEFPISQLWALLIMSAAFQ
jgi:hypothetical protein